MHKIFNLNSWLRRQRKQPAGVGAQSAARQWCEDPLSHPALARMSARELSDLPLGRSQRACRDPAVDAPPPSGTRRQ